MTGFRRVALMLAVLSASSLTACTHSSTSSAGSAAGAKQPGRVAAAALRPAGAAAGGSAVRQTAFGPLRTQQLIRTADLTVAVRGAARVAGQADAAETIADRAGGEVDADDRTSGARAVATLQLRVPPDQLQQVLHDLAALGSERTRSSTTTDVTGRTADVTSRVRSAQDSLARLRSLYASAKHVSDVIAIESRITDREADLESLLAQQRALAGRTTLATVTLHLVTAPVHPHRSHGPAAAGGFVGGLKSGWHAFATSVSAAATALGALLPFLALLLVLVVAARLLGVRIRVPRRARTAPPSSTG